MSGKDEFGSAPEDYASPQCCQCGIYIYEDAPDKHRDLVRHIASGRGLAVCAGCCQSARREDGAQW